MPKQMNRVLVTGAAGQIGSELITALAKHHGEENVIASDIRLLSGAYSGPYAQLDVTDLRAVDAVVAQHQIDTIYHLAAILSAKGEDKPQLCWQVNVTGLSNILVVARQRHLARVFCPSSIAVFGCEAPCYDTPQETILNPTTMYGVTKVTGELLCTYYAKKLGVDVRGVRYPGLISSETLPGGGTTDYAVDIFYNAIAHRRYTCFVAPETVLPMMYMPDAIKATLQLMEADAASLSHPASYNLAAMSFSAQELAAEVKKHISDFRVEYKPDFRQAIADSWPCTIDDSAARRDWNWQPDHDLSSMTVDMLQKLGERHARGALYGDETDEQSKE